MILAYGVLGVVGGLLCAIGDILLDYKGKGNIKIGKYKIIDSNWDSMKIIRFKISIFLATIGVPLYLLGFQSVSEQLKEHNLIFGTVFWLFASAGSIGGYFIHNIVCIIPIIYKTMDYSSFEQKEELINKIFSVIKIPFFVLYIFLVVNTSIMLIFASILKYLELHWSFLLLTPLSLLLIGMLLRKINNKVFSDFPGIIMPSIGISMIGLMAVINFLKIN